MTEAVLSQEQESPTAAEAADTGSSWPSYALAGAVCFACWLVGGGVTQIKDQKALVTESWKQLAAKVYEEDEATRNLVEAAKTAGVEQTQMQGLQDAVTALRQVGVSSNLPSGAVLKGLDAEQSRYDKELAKLQDLVKNTQQPSEQVQAKLATVIEKRNQEAVLATKYDIAAMTYNTVMDIFPENLGAKVLRYQTVGTLHSTQGTYKQILGWDKR